MRTRKTASAESEGPVDVRADRFGVAMGGAGEKLRKTRRVRLLLTAGGAIVAGLLAAPLGAQEVPWEEQLRPLQLLQLAQAARRFGISAGSECSTAILS